VTVTCDDDSPVAADDTATVNEDSGARAINVLANDTDTDAGTMAVQSVTDPADGTAAVTNSGADVSYTPDAGFCGEDTFDYELNGGSTATVTVTVTCVDDASVAVDDTATVAEDSAASQIDVLLNDTDSDLGPKTVASVTNPPNGSAAVTNSGADVSYTPDPDFCGEDEFDYTLNGGSSATVTVTVTCVDDAPTAVDDTATVAEDSSATQIDVLSNDTDTDAGTLTVTSVTNPPNGSAAVTNSGADVGYTPDADFCGTDTFQYTVNGGSTATVTVTVTCLDDLPAAVDDVATVAQDSSANALDVLLNDTDPDLGPKAVGSVTDPAHGSVLITNSGANVSYTPDAGFCGTDSFDYTLNGGSTATVTVTVTCTAPLPIDDMPVAVNDAVNVAEDSSTTVISVRGNDTDTDGGPMTVMSASNPLHGTAVVSNAGADVTYVPDLNFCGTDTFVYTLNGGSIATVTVTVTCVAEAPAPVASPKIPLPATDTVAAPGATGGTSSLPILLPLLAFAGLAAWLGARRAADRRHRNG
jgi:predicted RNA methylase